MIRENKQSAAGGRGREGQNKKEDVKSWPRDQALMMRGGRKWGRETEKEREMTCLEQTNPRVKREKALLKKKKTVRGKMSGGGVEKKDCMLMQSQVFRNSDMKGRNGEKYFL